MTSSTSGGGGFRTLPCELLLSWIQKNSKVDTKKIQSSSYLATCINHSDFHLKMVIVQLIGWVSLCEILQLQTVWSNDTSLPFSSSEPSLSGQSPMIEAMESFRLLRWKTSPSMTCILKWVFLTYTVTRETVNMLLSLLT